ncbi:MAG: protoglobin domain-containing protein [Alphaproteobacteria bacterium]
MTDGSRRGRRPPATAGGREQSVLLRVDEEDRARRLAFNQVGDDDVERLAGMRPLLEPHLDDLIGEFYSHLLRFSDLERLLRDEPDRVTVLQRLQRDYFEQMLGGPVDAEYFEARLRVGNAHQRIGLQPQWYIGAFGLFLRLALRVLDREVADRERLLRDFESLLKAVFLDMSLAIDTYILGGFVDRETAARLREATGLAEAALRERQATERLKDDLTSMVVHDLKNPVNGIAMMVELALRKGADLPEAHRGYLRHIERTCREMSRLIQNLLEVSRLEEGKMPVARERFAPEDVVREVLRELGPVAGQAERRIVDGIPPGRFRVLADRALLKRVLVNLVANALRHSGSQEVQVRGREAGPGAVRLEVADRGRGVRPEDATRIFEKFQSRPSASEAPGDTGLGLPFCKLAVEAMDGTIGLDGAPGDETVFWVLLPAA